jgi:hypothetical protein
MLLQAHANDVGDAVEPLDDTRLIYRDTIDIDAGSLQLVVGAWANCLCSARARGQFAPVYRRRPAGLVKRLTQPITIVGARPAFEERLRAPP